MPILYCPSLYVYVSVAEEVLSSLGALHKRLTLARFRVYIDQLTEDMTLQEFEEFADYLIACVEVARQ